MTRKFKALGLALMAVFAFGAVAASGASAASFHSEVAGTILTGSADNNQVFAVNGITLTCTNATFKGTAAEETQGSVTVFPEYSNCGDNIGHAHGTVPVDTTGCAYVFGATTNASGHLPVEVECTSGKKIVITDTSCTISVGPQTATNGVQLTNLGSGSGRSVTVHATATVAITKGGQAGCFFLGNSGTYTGTASLAGFVDSSTVGNLDEPGATYNEGAGVGIWWE